MASTRILKRVHELFSDARILNFFENGVFTFMEKPAFPMEPLSEGILVSTGVKKRDPYVTCRHRNIPAIFYWHAMGSGS